MREMFTKLKAISYSLRKAVLLRKLDCGMLQRLERGSRFHFNKKYLNDFQIHKKAFDRVNKPSRSVREDSSLGRIQLAPLLQNKTFDEKTLLNDCVF